jgi:hypothetical protein
MFMIHKGILSLRKIKAALCVGTAHRVKLMSFRIGLTEAKRGA